MARGLGLRAAHRRPAGPAHPPRPYPGDERRELPAEAEQAQTRLTDELLIRQPPASTPAHHPLRRTRLGEEGVFRSRPKPPPPPPRRRPRLGEEPVFRPGLTAPPCRRRRPSLQTPSSPTNPDLLPAPLVYFYSAALVWFCSALDRFPVFVA